MPFCSRAVAAVVVGLTLAAVARADRQAAEPVVSLRYPVAPGRMPTLDDLAAIKVAGFEAIVWPDDRASGLAEVRRLAETVGLTVIVKRPASSILAADRARTPDAHVGVRAGDADARILTPLVWRAVAHGARSIAFAPEGGLSRADGTPAAWVAPAVAISRQLSANRRLLEALRPGPALVVAPESTDVDVVLLDGGRAWVIVATNLSASPIRARVTFPKGIPSGLWASWIDDSEMSMLYQPTGPVWTVQLEGYGTRVYFIDKSSDAGRGFSPGHLNLLP